ncbi:hypothetical protein ABIE27_002205 [Paenibacillus sp. 4624]|jgi:hypothetical protein|uniref:hypothetical protein n=1 Tax=Paenibacillus TaxID=44249 RepID=UPI0013750555|nr:hypothetical protein [Paenibacillus amylolyticus]
MGDDSWSIQLPLNTFLFIRAFLLAYGLHAASRGDVFEIHVMHAVYIAEIIASERSQGLCIC